MHHQLGGSTEDDMNKMSVIGHFFHVFIMLVPKCANYQYRYGLPVRYQFWYRQPHCLTSLFPNLSDPISNTRHSLNTPKRQIYT